MYGFSLAKFRTRVTNDSWEKRTSAEWMEKRVVYERDRMISEKYDLHGIVSLS